MPRQEAVSLEELRRSDNPRWGTVREVIVREPYAAVLDDLNSDRREIELRVYERVADGWRFVHHQDDVSGSDGEVDRLLGWSIGHHVNSPGTWCALGRATPGARVLVSFGELAEEIPVDSDGWWLWVRMMGSEEAETVFARHPTKRYVDPELQVQELP